MAYEGEGIDITVPAAADLSSHQYKYVKVDANGRCNITSAVTDISVGILQNKPSAVDVPGRVRVAGVSKLKFNAAIDDGVLVTSNTQGFGVAQGTAGAFCGAITLHSVGGSGDVGDVLVVHTFQYNA